MSKIRAFFGRRESTVFFFLFCLGILSCASIQVIEVLYQLPPPSQQHKGKEVVLAFEDVRASKEIMSGEAKKVFDNFSGNFSFVMARHQESGFKVGVFQVSNMVLEGFQKRLQNEGLQVLTTQTPGKLKLLIVLEEFFLDLVDRNWIFKMKYEAKVMKERQFLASETISGKGTRARIVGTGQADSVVSEIFTNSVNTLDLARLFQKAKLER